jgi:hypothetical protein
VTDSKSVGRLFALTNSRSFKVATLAATIFALVSFPLAFPPIQNLLFGKENQFTLERLSEIPLVDINRPLGGLKVEFQGKDLTALDQGVVASQVQLRNTGDESITPAKMAAVDPIGFEVRGGNLVRVSLVEASSDHLRKFARLERAGNRVTLSPQVIFDPGDYVRFDLLVLKPQSGMLRYHPIGKVEGIDAIGFRDFLTQPNDVGLLERAFGGDGYDQTFRHLAYFLAGLDVVVLGMFLFIQVDARQQKKRDRTRARLATDVLTLIGKGPSGVHEMAADIYKLNGTWMLKLVESQLRHPLPTAAPSATKGVGSLEPFLMDTSDGDIEPPIARFFRFDIEATMEGLARRLRDAKLVNPKNGAPSKIALDGFIAFREALENRAVAEGLDLKKVEVTSMVVTERALSAAEADAQEAN